MMMYRDKHIGRSTYRIERIGAKFFIRELRPDGSALTPYGYYTFEDAADVLAKIDKEGAIYRL